MVGSRQARGAQRLSSGYRINSAADDAAGLGISEKMRAQIRGLDQASRNAQDGISLIQTAEGAMSTINEMVTRIRELVVQAANDTNAHKDDQLAQSDRVRIQDEINQLMDEIDATRARTEFNTRKLIDGSLGTGAVGGPGGAGGVDAEEGTVPIAGELLKESFWKSLEDGKIMDGATDWSSLFGSKGTSATDPVLNGNELFKDTATSGVGPSSKAFNVLIAALFNDGIEADGNRAADLEAVASEFMKAAQLAIDKLIGATLDAKGEYDTTVDDRDTKAVKWLTSLGAAFTGAPNSSDPTSLFELFDITTIPADKRTAGQKDAVNQIMDALKAIDLEKFIDPDSLKPAAADTRNEEWEVFDNQINLIGSLKGNDKALAAIYSRIADAMLSGDLGKEHADLAKLNMKAWDAGDKNIIEFLFEFSATAATGKNEIDPAKIAKGAAPTNLQELFDAVASPDKGVAANGLLEAGLALQSFLTGIIEDVVANFSEEDESAAGSGNALWFQIGANADEGRALEHRSRQRQRTQYDRRTQRRTGRTFLLQRPAFQRHHLRIQRPRRHEDQRRRNQQVHHRHRLRALPRHNPTL